MEDAANIERDAEALRLDLKGKTIDQEKVKADIQVEGQLASLTAQQQQDWELIKNKVQLLTIFF